MPSSSSSSSRVDGGLTHSISKILERPSGSGGSSNAPGLQPGPGAPGGFHPQVAAAHLMQLRPKWRCQLPLLAGQPATTTEVWWLHDLFHAPQDNHRQARHHLATAPARQTSSRRAGSRYSKRQVRLLKDRYRQARHLSREQMRLMAEATGLTMQQVKVWFQNRRLSDRKVREQQERQHPSSSSSSCSPSFSSACSSSSPPSLLPLS